jgi:hypothetical protein
MMAICIDISTVGSAATDAASVPLDPLLRDAAFGALRQVNPGGYTAGNAEAQLSRPMAEGFPTAETRRG